MKDDRETHNDWIVVPRGDPSMKGQVHIDLMYAFVMRDDDGTEGVCGVINPYTQEWLPLVGADLGRVESLRPIAQQIARELHKPVTLAVFKARHNLETFDP